MNTGQFNPLMKDTNLRYDRGSENDALNQLPPQFQLKQEYQILSNNFKVLDKVNFQLGNELAQLQVRLGLFPNPSKFSKEQLDNIRFKSTNPKIDLSYIEKLLNCYTAKIDKLETMVEMTNIEYRDMEQKADYLINDNSVLRQQLEEKCQQYLKKNINNMERIKT